MSAVPNYAGQWGKFEPKLRDEILEAIDYMGFEKMTPVQAATIPQFLGNRDVIVEAVTGSGKTLAFVIPVIEKLMRLEANKSENGIRAIVISPTRELAQQIFNVFETVLNAFRKQEEEDEISDAEGDNNTDNNLEKLEDEENEEEPPLKSMLLVGGTNSLADDIKEFKTSKPHIIIGTPGRLEDMLVRRKLLPVKQLEILVLDEADRLLEMGFQSTLTSIISILPKQRRTGLFSATMTEDLNELVRMGLRNPVKVMVKVGSKVNQDEQKIPTTLKIQYLVCRPDQKLIQLVRMITRETYQKYILYFNTCACVEYFYKVLNSIEELKDIEIVSLHGRMDVKKRSATFKKYTSLPDWQRSLLITTDVASRGLDLPDVDKVIQFDAPQDPKAFVHRCGRTARAGKSGFATLFLSPGNEELYPEFMSRRKIPMSEIDYFPPEDKQAGKFSWSDEDKESKELIDRLYQEVFKDRDFVDKGVRAYVSFIKSYTNHLASYIFQVKEFDFSSAAKGYLLLQLPRMPELKDLNIEFEPVDIDFDSIPYTNPVREEQRLKALELKKSQPKPEHKQKAKKEMYESWSKKKLLLERKINRREEKEKKRQQYYQENTVDGVFIDPKTRPKSLVDLKAHLNEKNAKKSKDKRGLQAIIQDGQQKTKAKNNSSDDDSDDSSDDEAIKDWEEFKRNKKQKGTKAKKTRYADL